MKKTIISQFKKPTLAFAFVAASFGTFAQTNVYDDVISTSPNHTTLNAALIQAGLVSALQDPNATLTVFAPDNAAFDALATALGVTPTQLLASPDLTSILTYHVLGQEVTAAAITNGQVATSLNTTANGTIYLTKTSTGSVFADQANVTTPNLTTDNGIVHVVNKVLLPVETVVDIAAANNFTTLLTAATQEELLPALTDPLATLTVFAPTNDAFTAIATALGTDINGLLALPTLGEILKYHVLGAEVTAANVTNGAIVNTLSTVNTLKMTKTSTGSVYANHAMVTLADVDADNGVVHVINNVVLPVETVVDRAIDGGFSTLVTAVAKAELLPALTNPLATLTVFAPTNAAFDDLADALGTDINGILALPTLGEVLKYHVLGSEVLAAVITNGQIVAPLSTVNTLKLTKTTTGNVFINQAQVTTANVDADNGVVHVIDEVVLPVETVADKAIDGGLTTLVSAVVKAELLPALSNPYTELTVFAPTNAAFNDLATALNTDLNGILALPNLADVLLYHVTQGNVVSGDLTNGSVEMLNGDDVTVDITNGVQINDANVTTANVEADNGVVHIIDAVLLPTSGLTEATSLVTISTYPNPATETIKVNAIENASFEIIDMLGSVVKAGTLTNNEINVETLNNGTYMIRLSDNTTTYQGRFIKR
ncbi:MAG: T9SS type A sorting domain-containing protein [Flavobacteriales bacterium]|nr:T9SS type A sorting domain-containing protein [Flavobacteriales bacterium]